MPTATKSRKTYQHLCPAARALEVIGEKWSLLVVRDLMPGPQRFTDLQRTMGGITPKWLTLRLRDLEAAGIVERDQQPGRREVWYALTPRGRALGPVVEALSVWGLEHAMRPPARGEPVHPGQTAGALAVFFNRRRVQLAQPALWVIHLGPTWTYTIRFDGARWSVERGEPEDGAADVTVSTTPDVWVSFLMAAPSDRAAHMAEMRFEGEPDRVAELTDTFGWRQHEARSSGE